MIQQNQKEITYLVKKGLNSSAIALEVKDSKIKPRTEQAALVAMLRLFFVTFFRCFVGLPFLQCVNIVMVGIEFHIFYLSDQSMWPEELLS